MSGDVQAIWNSVEHSLIMAADIVAPLIEVNKSWKSKKTDTPAAIVRMSNRRKYLLRIEQCKKDGHHLSEIRALNKSIRKFYAEKRRLRVRSFVGGSSGIWGAVGVAKDLNPNAIPASLLMISIYTTLK